MLKGSLPDSSATPVARPSLRSGTVPVVFGHCAGYLHPASGTTGIVLCGPWGYEELCVRAALRDCAERFAVSGTPCLRFDYPGTCNSLDPEAQLRLEDWIAAARSAADVLKARSGVTRIVFAGFGLGAILALEALRTYADATGLILLAPAGSGRRFARETAVWSIMVASSGEDSTEPPAPGEIGIAGFLLPKSLADDIKAFDITRSGDLPAVPAIVVERADSTDAAITAHLNAHGMSATSLPFQGYAELVAGPTTSQSPVAAFDALVSAANSIFVQEPRGATPIVRSQSGRAILSNTFYTEEAVRFGSDRGLYGVLTTPLGRDGGPIALLLNTGRNAHTGWRRMGVDHARALAQAGVSSFRFDTAGIGESPARDGQPAQMLYTEAQADDVIAALDFLQTRGFADATLVGICSGAYLGLLAALRDERVAALICVNLFRLVWDPRQSVEEALRFSNRPQARAVTRLMSPAMVKRVLSGAVDIRPAAIHALKNLFRRASIKTQPFLGPLSPWHALHKECRRRFKVLRDREVRVLLAYAVGDEGLSELADHFGTRWQGLGDFPNVRAAIIERADHNLTPRRTSEWLLPEIERIVAGTTRTHHD